ncbi:MAG: hypothetical protein ACLGHZ_05355 [Actinomycetes bacterium]
MKSYRAVALCVMLTLLLLFSPGGSHRADAAAPATDQTNLSFTSAAGVTSQYHVYAAGISEPKGLLLQFHGDGAYEFRNPTSSYSLGGSKGIVAQARARNLITVPVLSPDRSGEVTWWEAGARNADFVRDLLVELRARYSVRADRIWLVGYSGGAQFITQYFLPKYSSLITGGGAVVIGGGDRAAVTAQPFSAAFLAAFPMHWYTGANDTGWDDEGWNALAAAKSGEAWYAGKGVRTSHEWPAGVSHTLDGRFGEIVARQLDAHRAASPTPTAVPAPSPSPSRTPSPTSSSQTPSRWVAAIAPSRRGVTVSLAIPRSTSGRTELAVTGSNGSTWHRYTSATGPVDLTLSSLRPNRRYSFRIVSAGVAVATGTFTTLP